MGLCETKKEENKTPQINIIESGDKEGDIKKENERVFPGNGNYFNTDKFDIISKQKEKGICKIMKNENPIGTGFLCYVIGEYKNKRKALITAYHVLGKEDLKIGNEIKLVFNDNKEKIIKIEDIRRIYANENDDITIIEIIDKDNLNKNIILELDDSIYNTNINFKKYEDKSIYILHYPKGMFSSFSDGVVGKIENNIIYHRVATEHGSSGAPILNLDTLKVIGIHQAYDKEENYNEGKILKESIKNFNKENKIKLTLKINESDIGKKIYFLQNKDEFKKHYLKVEFPKLNRDNIVVLIDGEICRYENYYKFPKEGIYNVTIYLNYILKDCTALFCCCKNIIDIDLSSFDTKNVNNMSWMFCDCSDLTNLNLSSFDTKNVTDMSHMFYGCSDLTNLNLSSFDTKNVTDMSWMFRGCSNLTNLNLSSFDTKNVTYMSHMFSDCSNLTNLNLSSFDTKNVTKMSLMFHGCSNLKNLNLSSFDTKNVTNMSWMFENCSKLTNLNLSSFDTKNVTDMEGMFSGCSNLTNLNLSSFDTKNVTNMWEMFRGCSNLTNLDIKQSSFKIKSYSVFDGCDKLNI